MHAAFAALAAASMVGAFAALGLIARARTEPRIPGLLPAVRTLALITAAAVYVAAIWSTS